MSPSKDPLDNKGHLLMLPGEWVIIDRTETGGPLVAISSNPSLNKGIQIKYDKFVNVSNVDMT